MAKNKMETSKKLLWSSGAAAVIMTAVTIHGSYAGHDMSQVAQITLAAWGAFGVVAGFYLWKSKNENRSKGVQKLIKDLASEHGIDAVARLAELIFRD